MLGSLGCGGGKATAVSGSVTMDGAPLADATVQLVPDGDNNLGVHTTKTDSSGRFQFAEKGSSNNPIQPGNYVLLVSKQQAPSNGAGSSTAMGGLVEVVPGLYTSQATSPLRVPIKEANVDLPTFELKSMP
ncbi:DUF6795 domain-containing protein [Anatilimnocola sp. NA78]|uniref:DUF6795 domain-containing protein n=1 Tax=Anatilimnocola sp. NA78 TaxID=3415683 RepID=UPI003CE5252F